MLCVKNINDSEKVNEIMKYKPPTFLIPCLFLWLLDLIATLLGQSSDYWVGNFSAAKELNPLFLYFISKGPAIFLVASVTYILLLVIILFLIPLRIAILTAFIASIVHLIGATSWMLQINCRMIGIILSIFIFISVKIVLDKEWHKFKKAYSYM
jgi:hypothetical protein